MEVKLKITGTLAFNVSDRFGDAASVDDVVSELFTGEDVRICNYDNGKSDLGSLKVEKAEVIDE